MAEKGISLSTIEIDILAGENLQPTYLAKNIRGLIPLLEMDDGRCIDETVAICRFLEEQYPSHPLMGNDAYDKATIESRQRHMEFDGLLPLADIVRNSAPGFEHRALAGRSDVTAIEPLVTRGIASFSRFLEQLDASLSDDKFIAGERFSIADITALCVVDFAKIVNISIPDQHHNILRWHQAVSARPSALA